MNVLLVFHSDTGLYFVAHPGLKLTAIPLSRSLKCWDYMHESPQFLCTVSEQSKNNPAKQLPWHLFQVYFIRNRLDNGKLLGQFYTAVQRNQYSIPKLQDLSTCHIVFRPPSVDVGAMTLHWNYQYFPLVFHKQKILVISPFLQRPRCQGSCLSSGGFAPLLS